MHSKWQYHQWWNGQRWPVLTHAGLARRTQRTLCVWLCTREKVRPVCDRMRQFSVNEKMLLRLKREIERERKKKHKRVTICLLPMPMKLNQESPAGWWTRSCTVTVVSRLIPRLPTWDVTTLLVALIVFFFWCVPDCRPWMYGNSKQHFVFCFAGISHY